MSQHSSDGSVVHRFFGGVFFFATSSQKAQIMSTAKSEVWQENSAKTAKCGEKCQMAADALAGMLCWFKSFRFCSLYLL